jgi:hypothetical protein
MHNQSTARQSGHLLKALGALALVGLALFLASQAAQAAPFSQEAEDSGGIWSVLLPLSAAAIAIERLIELMWNYIDWALLNVRGWKATDLKSSQYTQFKSGTSLVLGIVLGILVSNYTGMRLFDYLQPLAPRFLESVAPVWDVLITGFVIGAGTKPTHDVLGIITQLKNLLGNSAIRQREAAGAELAEGVLKLAQSEAQALIDVPGVGPARIAAPGEGMRGEGDDGAPAAPSATEQYIQMIHERTVI